MPPELGQVPMKEPLAYFLTWTAYGTWVPGDNRGWVAKPGQFRAPDEKLQRQAHQLMTDTSLTLDPEQRCLVETTIADHCRIRGWRLHAVNARTQHIHVVVTAPGRNPTVVMDQFKAWCTRRLKRLEQSRRPANGTIRQNWWTQRGSKRWLNNQKSLDEVTQYVREVQGDPTPNSPGNPIQA